MINNTFSIAGKNYQQLAPLFLRLAIGFSFMAHGWTKLSRGPEGYEKLLTLIHVPFPHIMAWVSPFVEVLGGFAIFAGIFVGLTAIPLICTMLVAMFTIHIHYGYSAVKTIGLTPQGPLFGPPGYEINLIYVAGLIALIISGAGKFSLDAIMAKKSRPVNRNI
ncbi:MAG: DoxX family protein [Mucilaginibacter sp.]|nr:DoxX family protein [Mucilaginibacter sp.]